MARRYDRSYDRRDRSYDRHDRSYDRRDRSRDRRRDRHNRFDRRDSLDRHPTYSPDRSYQGDDGHDNRIHYWLPDEGIDYQVIHADLGWYLGPEATVVRGLLPKVGTSPFRPLSS
jgi:hypothetical protein